MLTSAAVHQYLYPDYLQSNMHTDSKTSPLALLARTCSAIGKDTPMSKHNASPLEKRELVVKPAAIDPSMTLKRPHSENSKDSIREKAAGFCSLPTKDTPADLFKSASTNEKWPSNPGLRSASVIVAGITSSLQAPTTDITLEGTSPPVSSKGKRDHQHHHPDGNGHAVYLYPHPHYHQRQPPNSPASPKRHASTPSSSQPFNGHRVTGQSSASPSAALKSTLSRPSLSGSQPLPSCHHPSYHNSVPGHPFDSLSATYQSLLATHCLTSPSRHCSALKTLAATTPSPWPSCVTYTHVLTPSGSIAVIPICRDPYCPTCQLTLQTGHTSSTCSLPGCSQCSHEKTLTALSVAAHSSFLLPSVSPTHPIFSSLPSHLYHHISLPAAQSGGFPYVCSAPSGADLCGKRFRSSDELVQHFRSHSSPLDWSTLASSYASLGLPQPLSGYPYWSELPSLALLGRSYPRSSSPQRVGPGGGGRFHPYRSSPDVTSPAYVPPSLSPSIPVYPHLFLHDHLMGATAVP